MRKTAASWWQVPAIWWSLRRARARLRRSLADGLALRSVAGVRAALTPAEADRLAATVFAVGRRLRGSACLVQAIALAELLHARGVPASVVLGASKSAGRFAAHAWVESPLGSFDPQPERLRAFTPLERFPGSAPL